MLPKNIKRTLSSLFRNKSSLETLCSFLTPKEKFRFLCNSKQISKEFDSKLDDYFIPRKYQEMFKAYNNYYEDLFYKIILEIKRQAEKDNKNIKLYEFENDAVVYLKYLSEKKNKIIKISLIMIAQTEPWKIDFISKLLTTLKKNIHLVLSINLNELMMNDFFIYYCRPSKAINILEIIDIFSNDKYTFTNDFYKICFNWKNVNKVIINMKEMDKLILNRKNKKHYGYKLLNTANLNLSHISELDIRCFDINFHLLENFLYKCTNITKLSIKNIKFDNISDINDNSILYNFKNISELNISTNLNNVNILLNYFHPILSQIKKFKLEIVELEDGNNNNFIINNIKNNNQKENDKNINTIKEDIEYEQFANEYLRDGIVSNSRDLGIKKISFIANRDMINFENKFNDKKTNNDCDVQKENAINKINLNSYQLISSIPNLKNCEEIIYEIKEQEALLPQSNQMHYLINLIELNKKHLKFLEINIFNEEGNNIDINDFSSLINKIVQCDKLNAFILRYELVGAYAKCFNEHFKLGSKLEKIHLIHNNELNITNIINEHVNLNKINLELIMTEPGYSLIDYKKLLFNLDFNRKWKSIELTNYPITKDTFDYLWKNKDDTLIELNVCVNLTDMNDNDFYQVMKTFIN